MLKKQPAILILTTSIAIHFSMYAWSQEMQTIDQVLVETDWKDGIPKQIELEARDGGIESIKGSDGRDAIRASVTKEADYSRVANGSARAEVQFSNQFRFQQGSNYTIQWSTYIPKEFESDEKKFVIFTQIHQGERAGPPTLAITMLADNYAISQRGGENPLQISAGQKICCISNDVGRWVNWKLDYTPYSDNKKSKTILWKDGLEVFNEVGKPNAYEGDNSAYMKFGLYKPHWNEGDSNSADVSMLFGPIKITKDN